MTPIEILARACNREDAAHLRKARRIGDITVSEKVALKAIGIALAEQSPTPERDYVLADGLDALAERAPQSEWQATLRQVAAAIRDALPLAARPTPADEGNTDGRRAATPQRGRNVDRDIPASGAGILGAGRNADDLVTTPADDAERREGIAIPEGMVPWHGGARSPEDWDGGPTFLRNGVTANMTYWPGGWAHRGKHDDIIAYTPKPRETDARMRDAVAGSIFTLEEQRRRCQRWGKSHAEIDAAITEARAALESDQGE